MQKTYNIMLKLCYKISKEILQSKILKNRTVNKAMWLLNDRTVGPLLLSSYSDNNLAFIFDKKSDFAGALESR